jgi:TP901 family phage tail tape measure protein
MMNVGIVQAIFRLDDQFSAALNMISGRMTSFSRMTARLGNAFVGAGLAMTTALTAPMAGLVKVTSDFETSFANVVKTVDRLDVDAFGNLNADARKLREEIRGLAREIPVTHNELARIAAVGGQFGVETDQITNFTEVVAKLGVAIDGIEPENAAASLAQIRKIAQVSWDDFDRLASTLVDLGNKGTSTEQTILEMTRRFAGAGASAGVAVQDMFGLAAATANLGHEAELGGTAISRTFLEISRGVADGGEELKKFAEVSQMSSAEFAKSWSQDSMATFQTLLKELRGLDPSQLPNVMASLFGKDIRQTQVLMTLIQDYEGFVKTLGDSRTAYEQNTAAAEEARKKFATFANQAQLLKNQLTDVAITLGEPVLRALRNTMSELDPLITGLEGAARAFGELPAPVQSFIVSAALIASTLGPVLAAVGGLVWGISQLGLTFAGVAVTLKVGVYAALATAITYLVGRVLEATGALELAEKWGRALGLAMLELWNVLGRNNFNAIVTTAGELWGIFGKLYNIFTISLQPVMDLLGHTNLLSFAMGTLKGVVGASMVQITAWLDVIRAIATTLNTALGYLERFTARIAQMRGIKLPEIPGMTGVYDNQKSFAAMREQGNRMAEGGLNDFAHWGESSDRWANTMRNNFVSVMNEGARMRTELASDSKYDMEMRQRQMELAQAKSAAITEANRREEEAARNLAQAQQEQGEAFLKAMGADVVQHALQLADSWEQAKKAGLSLSREAMVDLAESSQAALAVLKAFDLPLPDRLYEIRDAAAAATLDLTKLGDVGIKVDFTEGLDEAAKNLKDWRQEMRAANWGRLIEGETDKVRKSILEMSQTYDEAMQQFKEPPPLGVSAQKWRDLGRLVEANYITKIEKAVVKTDEYRTALMAIAPVIPQAFGFLAADLDRNNEKFDKIKEKTDTFGKSIRQLSTAFSQLSEIGDLGPRLQEIAELVALMAVGTRIGGQFRDVLSTVTKDGDGNEITKFDGGDLFGAEGAAAAAAAWVQLGIAVVQAYEAMQKATDVSGKANRVMRGAMTGASIGGSIVPGYGHIIGAAVGAIWGAVRKVGWEEIGKRVGLRLGVSISEQLMRSIEQDAKKLFNGDWLAAETFNLGAIIDEAGGVTSDNYRKLIGGYRDALVMFANGTFTAAQTMKVLDDSFQEFLEAGTDGLGFIDLQMKEIIATAGKLGLKSREIAEWQRAQATSILEAFDTIGSMSASFLVYEQIGKDIAEAREELETLGKETERGADWAKKHADATERLTKALGRQQGAAALAVDELNDIGTIGVASVLAGVAAGLSLSEALEKSGKGLDSLIQAYKDLGLTPEDPLTRMILQQRELQNIIPGTMQGVGALGQSIVGLTNLNMLNADTFSALQNTAYRAYQTIQGEIAKMGGGTKEALLPMQTYLQQAERAARDLGIPLDENTQMLIDQSKELGIWKELGPTAAERTETAIINLNEAIDRLTNALLGIPNEIPDPFRNWNPPGSPNNPGGNPGGNPPENPGPSPTPDPSEPGRGTNAMSPNSVDMTPYRGSSTASTPSTIPIVLRIKNAEVFTEAVLSNADHELALRGVRS